MYEDSFLFQALVYLTAAVISVPVAKKLGLGSVLGYLIAGVVIGPALLGLTGKEGEEVMHFSELGVIMMLFVIGLELEPALLWRMRSSIMGMGGMQVLITTLVISVICLTIGLRWNTSLALGLILSLSSTAIVLQMLSEKGLMKSSSGQNSFSILLFQDIAVIPMLAILPLLAIGNSNPALSENIGFVNSLPGWLQTAVVLGSVALIVIAGRFIIRPAFRIIAQTRLIEIFTAASLLLIISIAALMSQVGLSPALGTFLAGVVLANSEYRHELISDIEPFKGLLLGLFFISVGATINFRLVMENPFMITALVLVLMLVKGYILFGLGKAFKINRGQNLITAFALSQVGEFAFVLFSFASQNNVIDEYTTNIIVAVVALTMAMTPVAMALNEKFILPRFGKKEEIEREADKVDEHNPIIIAGFDKFGNTAGRFLKANGIKTTVLDYDSDRVDMLRKLGLKVYYGDASRRDLLRSAGADYAKLIIIAFDDAEKNIALVETIKKHYPHLKILVRAIARNDAYRLIRSGVDEVYRDTLDVSLRLGIDALKTLGIRAHHAHRAAKMFLKHDEKALRELANKVDRGEYISSSRQYIIELEELMKADAENPVLDRDFGWDPDSLREEALSRSPRPEKEN